MDLMRREFSWVHLVTPVLDGGSPLADPGSWKFRNFFDELSTVVDYVDAIVCTAGVVSKHRQYFDRSRLRDIQYEIRRRTRRSQFGVEREAVLQVLPNQQDVDNRVCNEWPFVIDPRDGRALTRKLGHEDSPFDLVCFPDDRVDQRLIDMSEGTPHVGDRSLILASRSGDFPSRRLYTLRDPVAVCHIGDDTRRPYYDVRDLPVGTTFHLDERNAHEHVWWRGTVRNRTLGSILMSALCHRDEEGNLYAWPLANMDRFRLGGYQMRKYFLEVARVGRPVESFAVNEKDVDTKRLDALVKEYLSTDEALRWLVELYPEIALHQRYYETGRAETIEIVRKIIPDDELLRQLSRPTWKVFKQNLDVLLDVKRGRGRRKLANPPRHRQDS